MKADVLVFGESAPGVAAAVRAAREGLTTLLVTQDEHFGGVLASLGAIETHYTGVRAPLLEEFRSGIVRHYRDTYGEDSEQYRQCVYLEPGNPMMTFEPSAALKVAKEMVEAENITVLHRYHPAAVELDRRRVRAVRLRALEAGKSDKPAEPDEDILVEADTFIDASYTGDLAAVAGVPYRVGRESRREHDEPHAGKLFTRWIPGRFPIDAAEGRLNLLPKFTTMGLLAGSTGEGDDEIQDYSYRLCLSDDPDNRVLPGKPEGYDREAYLAITLPPEETWQKPYALHHRFLTKTLQEMVEGDHLFHGHALPNGKRSWNATNFTGAGKAYPDGDTQTRRAIEQRHLEHALGILYFLQNDETVPEAVREQALEWGLAKDEFTDNANVPTHLYVREARRIWGRATFTEHDALLAPRSERTPVHADSVAVTDFPLDSLACTPERRPGTACDGQFFLQEQTRPAQVPYGVMLPERLDNLLVSVCCSVTHVAWGTVRQTPTLIQLAEAAGYAAALAKETRAQVADISVDALQRRLAENGHMLSFFNDFDMATELSWVPAVQYLGTKGYFSSYDARPDDISTEAEAEGWLEHARRTLPGMPENISLTGLKRGDAAEKLYALYKANATAPT